MSVAGYQWLERVYRPVVKKLDTILDQSNADPVELYCQVLEHKWYLSERAQKDVGHEKALDDYINRFKHGELEISRELGKNDQKTMDEQNNSDILKDDFWTPV